MRSGVCTRATRIPVVLDMDGVLVDSEPLFERAFAGYMSRIGRPELIAWFPNTLGRREADFVGELEPLVGRPRREIAADLEAALLLLVRDVGVTPMRAVYRALAVLADGERRMGLASSSCRTVIDHVLEALGISCRFDAVAGGDEVKAGKPAPDVYLLAAKRLGVRPRDCIAVEDTPTGIAAARAAGMRTIAVPNALTERLDLSAADSIVPDLLGAAARIKAWDEE